MHILFLTDNFPPEVNAPASRTFEHCRIWVNQGHHVTVITCAPNFPRGIVFPGYKNKLWQTENIQGIRVIRVWSYISANEGFLKRILDYISFMPSAVLASCGVHEPDIVIGTSPQFFTVCAAYLVGALKRIPFVFELRDIWPESIKAVGAMNHSLAIKMLEKIELFLYRKTTLIISVTHSFKEILTNRGVEPDKIQVITNGVDGSLFFQTHKDPDLLKQYDLTGKFVVGYVGTHGMAHQLETILDAAEIAQVNDENISFILLGDGASKKGLVELASKKGLKNVIFIESVSKDNVIRYYSLLDASIIHLKKKELFTSVIPSKLFESMAMGLPVLHGVMGESADIVLNNQVGLVFEPENAQALYDNLLNLKQDEVQYKSFREHALSASKKYDRTNLGIKFLKILQTIVKVTPI
jgi:glycosyltransferase involved in cell wall biosynthesis